MTAVVYGVGVGPGDPELLTLKATRVLREAPAIAYLTNQEGQSQARSIAASCLRAGQVEIAIPMAFDGAPGPARAAYDRAAVEIATQLADGRDVAVLCEGDPLFYGSFTYLLERLAGRFSCQVVPGVSSVHAAAAAALEPLARLDQRLAVVPASAGSEALHAALRDYDTVVILKPGRRRAQVLEVLRDSGRLRQAVYVEQASRPEQRIIRDAAKLPAGPGPYFGLYLVTGPCQP